MGVDGAVLAARQTPDGKTFFLFPALERSLRLLQIGSDVFPGRQGGTIACHSTDQFGRRTAVRTSFDIGASSHDISVFAPDSEIESRESGLTSLANAN